MTNNTQCENCKHFKQYYTINRGLILKVNCGVCRKNHKEIKPYSTKACEYFELIINEIEKEQIETYSLDVLKQIDKTLKRLKLYLEKNKPINRIDN